MASPANQRGLKDANLTATAALPNAANQVNTNVLDLGMATPYAIIEHVQLLVVSTAGNGANSKNISFAIHESSDNGNWANIAGLATPIGLATDNAGGGYPAASFRLSLPPSTKRYLRASATGEANGGNASNGSFTVSVVF